MADNGPLRGRSLVSSALDCDSVQPACGSIMNNALLLCGCCYFEPALFRKARALDSGKTMIGRCSRGKEACQGPAAGWRITEAEANISSSEHSWDSSYSIQVVTWREGSWGSAHIVTEVAFLGEPAVCAMHEWAITKHQDVNGWTDVRYMQHNSMKGGYTVCGRLTC